jgi:hypothetical protein
MRLQLVNINFKFGFSASNPNRKSVIFKPFNRIITNGGETGFLSHIFLNTHNKSSTFSIEELDNVNEFVISEEFQSKIPPEYIKVFGCICYTNGKKILFYPSFATSYLTKFKDRDKPEMHMENITIDHLSLEHSLGKWHITHLDGHIRDLKIHKVDDNTIYWFGMSLSSEVELEQVYQNNPFGYLCPVSDAERRIQDIELSLKYRDQHLITAPSLDKYSNKDSFYHFDFYIKIDSSIPSKKLGIFHIPDPCILDISISEKIPWISYEIDSPNFSGKLIIVATKISGKLTDNVIFTFCSN